MNVSYHKSTDGGATFESHNAPHGDHHDLWIAPEDNQRMIIADDGGRSSFIRRWFNLEYILQPTDCTILSGLQRTMPFPYRIYVAQQDNSTIRIRHRSSGSSIGEKDWESTAGGESAHIAIDPLNNEIVYGGSYDGFLTRVNHEKKSIRGINVWPDNPMGHGAEGMKYRFQWNFPIIFSKHNPKRLYTFSNQVHLTENEGQEWKIISPDLTRNDPTKLKSSGGPITQDNTSVEYYCTIFAANESPLKEGLLWVGSDDGLIHITQNGGKTWDNITPKQLPEWTMINSIEPSPFDPGTCYVAGTRYKLGDYSPYLYKTTDYGVTWKTITNGIAQEDFTRVVRSDLSQKGLLYAGTENGMYISYDDGASWKSFQKNLPIVPITDLTVKDNSLIVATQGRSLWMIDDLTVLHQLKSISTEAKAILFEPKYSYRTRGRGGKTSLTEGTNLPNGVIIHYYLKNYDVEKDLVELQLKQQDGTLIKSYSTQDDKNKLDVKKGGNQFLWNTRYEGAEKLKEMIFWSASFSGAKAVPGDYKVSLIVNGKEQEQPFTILPDPRSESSVSDMQKQFDFVNKVNQTVDGAHKAIKNIRAVNKKLKDFVQQNKTDSTATALIEQAKKIQKSLTQIEETLYQTQNRSNQDPLNFPIRLTNKLGHLNRLITIDDFPPTAQDNAVRLELTAQVDITMQAYKKIIDEDIIEFNKAFKKQKRDYLSIE